MGSSGRLRRADQPFALKGPGNLERPPAANVAKKGAAPVMGGPKVCGLQKRRPRVEESGRGDTVAGGWPRRQKPSRVSSSSVDLLGNVILVLPVSHAHTLA